MRPPIALLILAALLAQAAAPAPEPLPLRIGFFRGGRTNILMRMQVEGDFARHHLPVTLLAKELRGTGYTVISRARVIADEDDSLGKSTGREGIAGLLDGSWDLATTEEGSLLEAAERGEPVVAVARLGHNAPGVSGQFFALRDGVSISTASDYRGKLFVSRRGGPTERAFLLEYLTRQGVRPEDILTLKSLPKSPEAKTLLPRDKVLIVTGVFEDDLYSAVRKNLIDGGYFHLPRRDPQKFLPNIRPPDIALALSVENLGA